MVARRFLLRLGVPHATANGDAAALPSSPTTKRSGTAARLAHDCRNPNPATRRVRGDKSTSDPSRIHLSAQLDDEPNRLQLGAWVPVGTA